MEKNVHTSESKAYIDSFPEQSKLARKSRRVIRQINIPFGALVKYDCSSSKKKEYDCSLWSKHTKVDAPRTNEPKRM